MKKTRCAPLGSLHWGPHRVSRADAQCLVIGCMQPSAKQSGPAADTATTKHAIAHPPHLICNLSVPPCMSQIPSWLATLLTITSSYTLIIGTVTYCECLRSFEHCVNRTLLFQDACEVACPYCYYIARAPKHTTGGCFCAERPECLHICPTQ